MRAVVLDEHGDPEVLRVREVPDPVPGPDEVLVQVAATALNRADLLQRRGFYPGPPMAHEIPGMELAGTVVAVGERATLRSVGDEVMAIVGGGADAELVVVHDRQTVRLPTSVTLADAAAIPEVFITAWDALVLQGGLRSGDTALVHAGASGVGTAAIQICRALGARVVVTASAGKLDACRDLGADLAVDYGAEDFAAAVAEWTRGRGVDVVLDVIGGDYLARNIEALATGGHIVQVGVMGSGQATFPLGALLPKRASITGTVLRSRPLEEKIAISRRFEHEVVPRFDSGDLAPVIDSRYPLDDIASAHRRMEDNANVGKILVDVRPTA
jgi:NADPH2:quinone reductase